MGGTDTEARYPDPRPPPWQPCTGQRAGGEGGDIYGSKNGPRFALIILTTHLRGKSGPRRLSPNSEKKQTLRNCPPLPSFSRRPLQESTPVLLVHRSGAWPLNYMPSFWGYSDGRGCIAMRSP